MRACRSGAEDAMAWKWNKRRDFAARRRQMVERQLRSRDIRDERVLAAFMDVPRHKFVSSSELDSAYDDRPLSIGEGQTISQPYMVALMTQYLELKGDERTLEIGTGSGYQAAILSRLCREVFTVERIAKLSERAAEILAELGYDNIHFKVGDGTLGWPEEAPFDRIIITAGAPRIPPSLAEQLAEGGILVAPVGGEYAQDLVVATKREGKLEERTVCGCVFVRLIGKEGW